MTEEVQLTERELKIQDMIDNMLEPSDFVVVVNDSLEEYDLYEGSEALVAATQAIPNDENDIYNLRLHVVVHAVVDSHVDTSRMIMIDPLSVTQVSEERGKELTDIFALDFAPPPTDAVN